MISCLYKYVVRKAKKNQNKFAEFNSDIIFEETNSLQKKNKQNNSPKIKSILLVVLLALAIGCTEDDQALKSKFETKKVTDVTTKSMITDWYQSNLPSSQTKARIGNEEIVFDFDNLTVTTQSDNSIKTYVANSIDYSDNSEVNYSLGIYQDGENPTNALILKTVKESNNFNLIEYYSLSGILITSVRVNSDTKSTEIVYVRDGSSTSGRVACGNATAQCIANTYTNEGWLSVGLFVLTAINPAVSLSVAGACAAYECVVK